MATRQQAYDHPAYTAVYAATPGEAGGAATTIYSKFAAHTALIVKSATMTVTVAGTNTGARMAVLDQLKYTSTSTTTVVSSTFGTNAANTSTNVSLSDLAMAQGDVLVCQTGTDATMKLAVTYEYQITPGANTTV